MTPQRVPVKGDWNQGLNGRPESIDHLGIERAHNFGNLHLVVGVLGKHPKSLGVQHHDRWMVTYPRGLLFPIVCGLSLGANRFGGRLVHGW